MNIDILIYNSVDTTFCMNYFNKPSFSTLMFLRHRISPNKSLKIMSDWLKPHPERSQKILIHLFKSGEVIFKDNKIVDTSHLSLEEAQKLATKIQQEKVLETKDRWYRLKCYVQSFIGSKLVEYLCQTPNITEAEAISIGQDLLKYHLISHVCNEHDFKNDFLFYRFQN